MPILPIFLFQNALELHTPNSRDPEALRVPGLTEEILLEKIVQDSLKVSKFQNPIFLFSFEKKIGSKMGQIKNNASIVLNTP